MTHGEKTYSSETCHKSMADEKDFLMVHGDDFLVHRFVICFGYAISVQREATIHYLLTH